LGEEAKGVGDAVRVEGLVFAVLVVEASTIVPTLNDVNEHGTALVLLPALLADVGGDAKVHGGEVCDGIVVWVEAADNGEALSKVNIITNA
jgi:hypothetical protein